MITEHWQYDSIKVNIYNDLSSYCVGTWFGVNMYWDVWASVLDSARFHVEIASRTNKFNFSKLDISLRLRILNTYQLEMDIIGEYRHDLGGKRIPVCDIFMKSL